MKILSTGALVGSVFAVSAIFAGPAAAEDCDAMIGQINELLETAQITEEEKQQVYDLRDQGMGENTRASGDCTSTLSQALDILEGND